MLELIPPMTVVARAALVLTIGLTVSAVHAQRASRAEPRWFQLEGSVVTAARTEPIRGAMITVVGRNSAFIPDPIFADWRGQFVVRVPDVAGLSLRVSKPGFVAANVPVARLGSSPMVVPLRPAGVIAGRVLDEHDFPLFGFQVSVSRETAPRRPVARATTDDLGEFRISGLPPGRYIVSLPASEGGVGRAAGSTAAMLSALTPGQVIEQTVDVEAGGVTLLSHQVPPEELPQVSEELRQYIEATRLQLATARRLPQAVITGRVIDANGDPLDQINVFAVRLVPTPSGAFQLDAGVPRLTDDRGAFRLFGLRDGSYLIFTSLKNTEPLSGAVYGGAGLDKAFPVRTRIGHHAAGLEVMFRQPRESSITGSVDNASGRTGLAGVITLAARTPFGTISLPTSIQVTPDGTFEIPRLPAGSYAVIATGRGETDAREFGVAEVAIDPVQPGTVAVWTALGTSVAGRVTFDDETVRVPERIGLTIASHDPVFSGAPYTGGFIRNRTFILEGALGNGRLALEGAPPNWWIESITVDGRDYTDAPIRFGERDHDNVDVRIATKGGVIDGVIQGGFSIDRSVVAYSLDRQHWYPQSRYLRMVKAAGNRFSIAGLPPGTYYVAVVDSPLNPRAYGEWQNAEFLEVLTPDAQRVRIDADSKVTLQF